jgi:hypothetical protein
MKTFAKVTVILGQDISIAEFISKMEDKGLVLIAESGKEVIFSLEEKKDLFKQFSEEVKNA